MPDVAHIQLGSEILDIRDARVPMSDLTARASLKLLGSFDVPLGNMVQGMTTDGTDLFIATINKADGMSNPRMHKVNSSTFVTDTKIPPQNGHYNSLDFHDGYIYATGFNENDTYDNYSQIYRYDYNSNSGQRITTPSWFWNVIFGKTQYNTNFMIGHVASLHTFEVMCAPDALHPTKYYPFTICPIDHYNGIEQGAALYDNKYVCCIVADPRSVGNNIISNNELRINSLTGETVKVITLDIPISNEELQDICFIGQRCIIVSSSGHIYELLNFPTYFRGYYEQMHPSLWKRPCFIYGNENGTEEWINGAYGSETGKLLYRFKLAPFTVKEHFDDAVGYFNTRTHIFPFKINPISGGLNISCAFASGNYSYEIRMYYALTETDTNYIYTLAEMSGGYRATDGTLTKFAGTTYEEFQNIVNNVFYVGTSFIHHITANAGCRYTSDPLTLL